MACVVIEPSLPIALRLSSLYSSSQDDDVGPLLVSFINSHLQTCQPESCEDPSCKYFHWFIKHSKSCKIGNCGSCSKLQSWVRLHAGSCKATARCPLEQLCQDMKRMQLKDSFLQRDIHVRNLLHRPSRTQSEGSSSTIGQEEEQISPSSSINLTAHEVLDSSNLTNGDRLDISGCGLSDDSPQHWGIASNGLSLRECNGSFNPNDFSNNSSYFSNNPFSSPAYANSADPTKSLGKQSPSLCRDVHGVHGGVAVESRLDSDHDGPISFPRFGSVSSSASFGLKHKKPLQNAAELTQVQQRELIERFLSSKGQSSETDTSGLTHQPSCGDAAVSRLDSMMSVESSMTSLSGWSMGSSVSKENVFQSPKLGKRSSNHKLERMQNVSSMDLNSPPTQPRNHAHYPVQRQDTDLNRRFVPGARGSSITLPSMPHQVDDEDDDVCDDIGYPTQRSPSITGSKLLLARVSIGLEHLAHIHKAQENFTREQTASSNRFSQVGYEASEEGFTKEQAAKSNRSSRQSYELSEISTTPSLSPNTSGHGSQLNSLDSGAGGSPSPSHPREPCTSELWSPSSLGHSSMSTVKGDNQSLSPQVSHDPSVMLSSQGPLSNHTPTSHDSTVFLSNRTSTSHEYSQSPPSTTTLHSCYDNSCLYDNNGSDSHNCSGRFDPHIFSHLSNSESSDTSDHTYYSHTHPDSMTDTEYSTGTSFAGSTLPSSQAPVSNIEEVYKIIDDIMEENEDDILVMNNRLKKITQKPPHFSAEQKERAEDVWVESTRSHDDNDDEINAPSKFPETEMKYYRQMMMETGEEERESEYEVNRREELRKYLLGQFCRKQVYREGVHWMKQTELGKGGQATCYSILDRKTNLSLALKEEMEGDKSLDEAYICLKLAHDLNVTRNIVEYFGAAMLPGYNRNRNIVQLFMEIMPTSMQSYLFKNGPLCMADVHHFAFQLFDALEYLHNKENIIHCDIKPANLLLDYTAQRMKLADFGAAELLEEKRRSSDHIHGNLGAGTLAYNPPEHYSRQECSFALDMWQAGGCVLAMATGRRPWRNLFMDPLRQQDTTYHFNKVKWEYGVEIGNQSRGHMIPAFVDTTIHKLLYGCLHSDPKMRLTALECWRLLAYTEEMSEDQRSKVTDVLGYSSSAPLVLCDHALLSPSPLLDVYLGSHCERVVLKGCRHTLNPGWMGSVGYQERMTYGELCKQLRTSLFPVLQHLGPTEIALWDRSPQELFVATNPTQCSPSSLRQQLAPADPRSYVDPTKAIVLLRPREYLQRTLC